MGRTKKAVAWVRLLGPGALAVLATVPGCSAGQVSSRHEPRIDLAGSNAPAAAVFADPRVLASGGGEVGRRDLSLSPRLAGAQLAGDEWPEAPRPSLSRARRIRVESREGEFWYFEPEREYRPRDWDDRVPGWRPWW